MKNLNFALIWFVTSIYTLLFSILFLIHLSYPKIVTTPNGSNYQMYKALPTYTTDSGQETLIGKIEGRTLIVEKFLHDRKSPLAPFANVFIEVADKYKLDYRLLPAISMQESNGGKIMPINSYNPFGYGIYGGKVMRFESFNLAIETVGKGLRQNYLDQGLNTPEEIMAKYTPPSLQKGGSWAIGVSAFMEQLL